MISNKNDRYEPIACSFHDQLEAFATTRALLKIFYRDAHGPREEKDVRIVDILVSGGAEFIVLDSQEKIRLDHLIGISSESGYISF